MMPGTARGEQVHRMHRLPGNRLPIYEAYRTSDVLDGGDSLARDIELRIWDVHGNGSKERWHLLFAPPVTEKDTGLYRYDEPFAVRNGMASASGSAHVFYDDFAFPLELQFRQGLEARWQIGPQGVPASLPLSVELPLDSGMRDKVIAVRMDQAGRIEGVYTGRTMRGDVFSFETKTCGIYQLVRDTIAPLLRPHRQYRTSDSNELEVRGVGELRFDLSDQLSGIETYGARLDGEWILFRWDPKRERIWYECSDQKHRRATKQALEIWATDAAGNRVEWSGTVSFK